MRDVYIAAATQTPFGKYPDSSLRALASSSATAALNEAGLLPQQIGLVAFGNAAEGVLTGQEMVRAQVALQGTGLAGAAMLNVENACASSSSATHIAYLAIASGAYECALVVGAEKLTNPDKARSLGAIATAADVQAHTQQPRGAGSLFMDIYADSAAQYMARSGASAADFASVVVKSRAFGALNPLAQFTSPTTVTDVLSARSISGALTLPMCSAIGDGAAALILTSRDFAQRSGLRSDVRILASAVVSGSEEPAVSSPAARASRLAYEQTAIDPADLDVIELHDAAAPAELILYEELALTEPGCGVDLLRSGSTGPGGSMPVNPSGGLLSRGHPVGATGAAQLVELVTQLRGDAGKRQRPGARLAMAHNAGGHIGEDAAVTVVTILTNDV